MSEYGTDTEMDYDGEEADLNDSGSDVATVEGLENLYQSVRNRILTPMGSLPLHPTYGSRLHTLIGLGNNNITVMMVKMMVVESLQYEERIALIRNIDVNISRTTQKIEITIDIVSVYSQEFEVSASVG